VVDLNYEKSVDYQSGMNDNTNHDRPVPKRPKSGWLAWEATLGYIQHHHSPDATLKMEVYPGEVIVSWAASLSWGNNFEEVRDKTSLADVLGSLWEQVIQTHDIFLTLDAAIRSPLKYADDVWLDAATYDALSRLVHVTDTVFQGDWLVVVVYRPVEVPGKRLQTRLLAENKIVNRGGNGPTLRDACRDLYQKAAPVYQKYRQKGDE
jgi:hypothetical protein